MNIFNKLITYSKGGPIINKEENNLDSQMKRKANLKWTKLYKLLASRFK